MYTLRVYGQNQMLTNHSSVHVYHGMLTDAGFEHAEFNYSRQELDIMFQPCQMHYYKDKYCSQQYVITVWSVWYKLIRKLQYI